MKIIRNIIRGLFCLLIVSQTAGAASGAKYAGEFIAIGVGGRALGLGGAYSALANDVTAGYWNPAGLSKITYPQITLMHDERWAGLVNYDYGAIAYPINARSTFAFSVMRLGVDNIENTQHAGLDVYGNPLPPEQWQNFDRIDPSRITYFNAADWAFFFSYAKKVNEQFSYGTNLKIIRRELSDAAATGIGFDVGAQYLITEQFIVGANFQDVTTTFIAWSTGTNELLFPTLKIGSAYFIDAFNGRFAPTFDVDIRFENRRSASNIHLGPVSFDTHSGIEFDYNNLVAVRLGYSDIGSLNLGTGVHLPKLDIDYSFSKFDGVGQLGNTHRISLTFTLQAEQFSRSSK